MGNFTPALFPGKDARYPFDGRLGGPRIRWMLRRRE